MDLNVHSGNTFMFLVCLCSKTSRVLSWSLMTNKRNIENYMPGYQSFEKPGIKMIAVGIFWFIQEQEKLLKKRSNVLFSEEKQNES